jgi:UPF0755 protein
MEGSPRDSSSAPGSDRSGRGGGILGRRTAPLSPNEALQPEDAPLPPPRPKRKRRPVLSATSGVLTFLLIVAITAIFASGWSRQRALAPGPLPADKILYIAPGTDVPDIIEALDREKIIDDTLFFNILLVAEGKRSKLKAGEYLFKQNVSLREVIDTLVNGKQVLHSITIPEGLTSEQIVERLRESDILVGEIKEIPKEGSVLPETYKVARGTSRADLIKKMQSDQARIVDQIWARRSSDLPLRSPYELVTLASIVEKETGKSDERPRVAGVFLNRLQKRMRLQSDPTIVYGLVGGKGTLGRGISRAELDKPTPYNTYVIDGLPPGPIANPGRAALDAVANPARTKELYFVADGTGGHVFAETLQQHAKNVQKWRQIEKEAKESQEAPALEVDRSEPQLLPPAAAPPAGKRGAKTSTSIYGELPTSLKADGPSPANSSFGLTPAVAAIAKAATEAGAQGTPKKGENRIPANAFTVGPGLDELGITVRGVNAPSDSFVARPTLDGPSDLLNAPPPPVSPADAGDAAKAAALAAVSNPDSSGAGPPTRPRIYDVSEGTSLDPLRDKSYDLNHPKTVPALK